MVGAWMTSQLCHSILACQSVHGADDITTLEGQVNSMSICGPKFLI